LRPDKKRCAPIPTKPLLTASLPACACWSESSPGLRRVEGGRVFPELQPMYAVACPSPCVSEDNLVWLNAQLQSMSPHRLTVSTAPEVGLVDSTRGSYSSIFAGASLAPQRRIFAIKASRSIQKYDHGFMRYRETNDSTMGLPAAHDNRGSSIGTIHLALPYDTERSTLRFV